MAGRRVRLTPKGLLVMVRHRRISLRRSSGVGWVSAVNYGHGELVRKSQSVVPILFQDLLHCSQHWQAPRILPTAYHPEPQALAIVSAELADVKDVAHL